MYDQRLKNYELCTIAILTQHQNILVCPVSLIKEVGRSMSHDIIDISCAVSPGYSITDFNITSMSVKNQVQQSLK